MTAQSLEHRIADAFTTPQTSAAIQGLLDEADKVAIAARDTSAAAKAIALDPATRPEEVTKARREMEDSQFTSDRLTNAATKLKELLTAAKQSEAATSAQKEYKAAKQERDQLADELRKVYPELSSKLADLINRVDINTKRVSAANALQSGPWMKSAEAIARKAPDNWEVQASWGNLPKLTETIRLPDFYAGEDVNGGFVWPKPSRY